MTWGPCAPTYPYIQVPLYDLGPLGPTYPYIQVPLYRGVPTRVRQAIAGNLTKSEPEMQLTVVTRTWCVQQFTRVWVSEHVHVYFVGHTGCLSWCSMVNLAWRKCTTSLSRRSRRVTTYCGNTHSKK